MLKLVGLFLLHTMGCLGLDARCVVGLYSRIALNTLGCYAMLCSLSAELVQESDQRGQVTQVEMKCLLWISWLFEPYSHCSFIEYRL